MTKIASFAVILVSAILEVRGHGMVYEPPSRSSMWRWYEGAPINYDDAAVFCGGAAVQWQENDGKCGPCGDNWADRAPRQNENGGIYGRGLVARTYHKNTNMQVEVNITASHRGYFLFNICDLSKADPETDACFDENPMQLLDGSYEYEVTPEFDYARTHAIYLRFPRDLTCERCVMRWHYRAGNSYGICDDGTSALGCGAQETFRNCMDISIV